MSEPIFDITFYGIIQPGMDKEVAIHNMAQLFKTTPENVRPLFAGGRKVIKSRVNEPTANKYIRRRKASANFPIPSIHSDESNPIPRLYKLTDTAYT